MLAAHILDVAADAVVRAIALAADLLVAAQDRLATAHIDDDVAVFLALDLTVDDRAGAVLELLVLTVPLGFAHLLQDDLLGRLRRDAAHVDGGHFLDELVTDLGVGHVLFGLLHGELGLVVLEQLVLDHRADTGEGRTRRSCGRSGHGCPSRRHSATWPHGRERFFHRLDDQTGVDHLFARHGLGGLQQLKLVGRGNRHLSYSSCGPSSVSISSNLVSSIGPAAFRGAQHFLDQIVGQHQLGLGQPVELEADSAFSSTSISTSSSSIPARMPLQRLRPSISSEVSSLAS